MTKQDLMNIIVKVAPGTPLREGIDYILDAGIGALIIIGYDDEVEKVRDGGFFIDCDYSPERVFELSKMDGAIILNDDCSKILYANVHVQPNNSYSTTESGTRHRTAERAAKHLKREVVAISERKKNVTLYKGNLKYRLKNFDELNIEVGQVLKTLESYRHVLNRSLDNLTILELDDLVTVLDVANTLQRFEMVRRISEEITRYLLELGTRGRLVNMQVSELIWDLDEEEESFLKDYLDMSTKPESVRKYLRSLTDSELLDLENVVVALGYSKSSSVFDNKIAARGYRVLEKISKLTKKDIEKIISTYIDISEIQEATDEDLTAIKISRFKIKALRAGINRLKFTIEMQR